MTETVADILGDISLTKFVEENFHKLPYSVPGGCADLVEDCGWEMLTDVLSHPDADVMVARRNRQYAGELPHDPVAAQALADDGYTILVRHAERHHEQLATVAEAFSNSFGGEVNIHMYATPPGEFGFGWHYDAEEVFILQTQGRKEYSLRKNTVNPWPLVETIPADMQYERELMPLLRVLLAAGDWLYIPSGYWHYGQAEELAVSLAVGVMSPTAIDLFDQLRSELLDSLLWRQRLPVIGEHAGADIETLRDQYRMILKQLRDDLDRRLDDEQLVERLVSESPR